MTSHDGSGSGTPNFGSSEQHRETVRVQVGVIREAFDAGIGVVHHEGHDDADVAYVHRLGHVLVRSQHVDAVQDHFGQHSETYGGIGAVVAEPIAGLTLLALPARHDHGGDEATIAHVDEGIGAGKVTPDHVVYVVGNSFMCPATEPAVPSTPQAHPAESSDATAGTGVAVAVVDTGWWPSSATDGASPWISSGVGGDVENLDPTDIWPYGGHGTFVAGVVRCQAPAASIDIHGCLTNGGAIFESEIVKKLDEAMTQKGQPAVISISAGTHTRQHHPMMSFEVLAEQYALAEGDNAPLVVAAAGNDGGTDPFWPAAFPWVVSVGALDADGSVSDFSNVGPWVDVYALGRDHVNAFPVGTYTCYEPANAGQVRNFDGLATWSGTSFATPLVSGAIAAHMSKNGGTARQAVAALKAAGVAKNDPRAGNITAVGTPFA